MPLNEPHVLDGYFRVPHDNPPRHLLMLYAYVDESGQEQDDWMFVAGYVGNEDQWRKIAEQWKIAIAPRQHLHTKALRFKGDCDRRLLERLGAVLKGSGLTPLVAGLRQRDYRDLISGSPEEKALNGYICCCFALVINALRGLPANERLEITFERQGRYWWMAEIAMTAIASLKLPELTLPDGTTRLAKWSFVTKASTVLTEPADCFAFALLQVWRDRHSKKAAWCKPILDAHDGEGLGAILHRNEIREVFERLQILKVFAMAQEMVGQIHEETK